MTVGIVGIPHHEKRFVEGRWVCICPRCGFQTPSKRDPHDREAIRPSAKTYDHWRTHEACCECKASREQSGLTPLLGCNVEDCGATVCDECLNDHLKKHEEVG